MNLRLLPNIITILRIVLVAPIVWLLIEQHYTWALILFAVAGVSDALDGFLARHFHWQSWWGSVLDPLADKLLQVSCYITLAWTGHIPVWLVTAIVLRDLVIVSGALIYHRKVTAFEAEPSIISKFNTFVQIIVILMVVMHIGLYALPENVLTAMFWLVLFTTVYSGVDYVYRWTHRAVKHRAD